jgi:hypothetical protein
MSECRVIGDIYVDLTRATANVVGSHESESYKYVAHAKPNANDVCFCASVGTPQIALKSL